LAGTAFAQEVIREFQVITAGGGAEFGRAAAGAINIVTQAGTNVYRGSGYLFYRNARLDARPPLASRKDPLTQRQFGGSLGGPILRDRLFFFGNVERTLHDRTGVVTVPGEDTARINAALAATGYTGPAMSTGSFVTGY